MDTFNTLIAQSKIISFLKKECGVTFENKNTSQILDLSLLNSGILDSLSIFKLVSFLENNFEIILDPEQIHPDNIDTIAKICSLVASLKKRI